MPIIAIYKAFTFFIYMFDLSGEPPHLHISKTKTRKLRTAKIWLETLEFAETADFTDAELNEVRRVVSKYQKELLTSFKQLKRGRNIKRLILKK